jgi:hypothetical protein
MLAWIRHWLVPWVLVCASVFAFEFSNWLATHSKRPPVGVYIAIMGLVVALMTVREPKKWEKFLWIILATVLTIAEIRGLYVFDEQQTLRNEKVSRDLDATKIGIDTATAELKATSEGIRAVVSELTGADSYIYLDVTDIGGPLGTDVGVMKKGMMTANTFLHFVGKYPLHDVHLTEFGPFGMSFDDDYGTVYSDEIGKPRRSPSIYFYPNEPKAIFHFFITASNGSYNQTVLVKQYGGKWMWGSRLFKYGTKQVIRSWGAKGFPKNDLYADWDKLN